MPTSIFLRDNGDRPSFSLSMGTAITFLLESGGMAIALFKTENLIFGDRLLVFFSGKGDHFFVEVGDWRSLFYRNMEMLAIAQRFCHKE